MSTKRIDDIEGRLRRASTAYYVDANPIMSDKEFDTLKDELAKLDPDNEFLHEIGAALDSSPLTKVKHEIPMGSLNKVNTLEEYETWLKTLSKQGVNRPSMVAQWKLDGSSVELLYRKGKFVQAVTRGDGVVGEDVTHSISKASGFPKRLNKPIDCSVRAEAFIRLSDWEEYLSGDSKNPRNTAAGIVRRTDTKDAHFLRLQAYNIILKSRDEYIINNEMDKINILNSLGFDTVSSTVHFSDEIPKTFKQMTEQRNSLDFQVDGVVVTLNDIDLQEQMGEKKGLPYFARAWKFEADSGISRIKDVVWSMGSRGTIHPTAIVEPVEVCGVTIQNASLHNLDIINDLGVCIGDEVEIIRAGDVIPKVCRVSNPGKNRTPIEVINCPSCGKKTVVRGPHAACPEPEICPGVQSKRISTFISKREIMFLGDANLVLLLENGCVRNIPDLYRLDVKRMMKAGLGETMATKILAEIEKSRNARIEEVIGSLSIDLCGRSEAANIVAFGIDTLDKWESLTVEQLASFERFGEVKAKRIYTSLKENWTLIDEVVGLMNLVQDKKEKVMGSLSDKSFCFTGALELPRKEAEALVMSKGGSVSSSVSKGLTFLVMADPNSTSTKAEKARKLGTQVISESEFMSMVKA